jgi:hypothetical protein
MQMTTSLVTLLAGGVGLIIGVGLSIAHKLGDIRWELQRIADELVRKGTEERR